MRLLVKDGIETNLNEVYGKKISETLNKKVIINDQETTIAKERGKKLSIIKNRVEKGETLTNAQLAGKKLSKTLIENDLLRGANNPKALKINIYDEYDNLLFECNGNLKQICSDNGLPFSTIRASYLNNKKVYEDVTNKGGAIAQLTKKGFYKFKGWYAVKIV